MSEARSGDEIPHGLHEITPEWLTKVLQPHLRGSRVTGVTMLNVIYGSAVKAVIKLDFAGGQPNLPATLCVKGGLGQPIADAVIEMGAYEGEGRFYRNVLPELKLSVPETYYIEIDPGTRDCILIMPDLTARGAVFSRATTTALTTDQVARLLEDLAQLHARWWGCTEDPWFSGLERGIAEDNSLGHYFLQCDPANVGGWLALPRGDGMPRELHDPARLVKAFWANEHASLEPPHCLLHGDSHVGNTYVLPDGSPGFCDWQALRLGRWSHDVSYFVGSSLAETERGCAERQLLNHYLGCLAAHGATAPSHDEAWLTYRRSMMYGLFAWLTNLLEFQPEEISAATTRRFAVAVTELDTLRALGV